MRVSDANLAALMVSAALHAAILFVPLGLALSPPRLAPPALPNSVAMVGSSIEVEAPTAELAAPAPAAAAAEPTPTPEPEPEPDPAPANVRAWPKEPDAAPVARAPKPKAPQREPRAPSAAKAKPSAKPPSDATSSAPSTAAAGSEANATGATAAGTFGQEGLAPGVRRLGYAFTRAIPAASPADGAWRELPVGHVGTIRIELEVDENNRLGALKRWQARSGEAAPPAVLVRMVERTLILLRAGQFALSGSNSPGSERLTIDVTIRDEAADEEGADVVVQKKFDGAAPGRPGTAYFRYGTGRAVEAKVTISKSGP